jgi:ribonuclease III
MPKPLNSKSGELLQETIGYSFNDQGLLKRATTHRSASSEHMERLEFLGDAVLGLVISEYLHQRFLQYTEGELSRMRAALVRKESLLKVAKMWKLAAYLNVGEGERNNGKLKAPSIAANGVEAMIGAVFEDGGWKSVKPMVLKSWESLLKHIDLDDVRDAKSRLQEFTQGQGWGLPQYRVTDHGVGKSPRFTAHCSVNSRDIGEGSGERKKLAELAAAEMAWEKVQSL